MYICINCGTPVRELYRKYSSSALKTSTCDKCHKVADKYIEFESVIVLCDQMLLSQSVYRHVLYNRSFKLHWKLSLVLLMMESFALWHKTRAENYKRTAYVLPAPHNHSDEMVLEKGFYVCCLQRMLDYIILTSLLLIVILLSRGRDFAQRNLPAATSTLMKGVSIANLSKFFLLPIMVWRENTTEMGYAMHQVLVLVHYLCALTFTFAVVFMVPTIETALAGKRPLSKLQASVIVLPVFCLKEYLHRYAAAFVAKMI